MSRLPCAAWGFRPWVRWLRCLLAVALLAAVGTRAAGAAGFT